jgi:hypothetical protein
MDDLLWTLKALMAAEYAEKTKSGNDFFKKIVVALFSVFCVISVFSVQRSLSVPNGLSSVADADHAC